VGSKVKSASGKKHPPYMIFLDVLRSVRTVTNSPDGNFVFGVDTRGRYAHNDVPVWGKKSSLFD